jgi:hypothetical protein
MQKKILTPGIRRREIKENGTGDEFMYNIFDAL